MVSTSLRFNVRTIDKLIYKITLLIIGLLILSSCHSSGISTSPPGQNLTPTQLASVKSALTLIRNAGLKTYADLGDNLLAQNQWQAALPNDPFIAQAEKGGDTPFAYTLPDNSHPKQPIAIILAGRFFIDADPTAQAALMVHELGHWMAFQRQGSSTEYDGYKAEFDSHKALGLTSADGLVYTFMLDGVDQYVVPIDKSYAKNPEVAEYIKESSSGSM
jgi:hypothetical protein